MWAVCDARGILSPLSTPPDGQQQGGGGGVRQPG